MDVNRKPKVHKARLSKNRKKKSWRKFSNVKDVEDFLDEERDDARTGGPIYAKKNSELFIEDILPGPVKPDSLQPEVLPSADSDASIWKDLKCFKGISGNRAPERRKPHGNKALEVQSKILKRSVGILVKEESDGNRRQERRAKLRKLESSAQKPGADPVFNRNLWGADSKSAKPDQRQAAITKTLCLPPTLRLKKPSGFSAVEVPHPGTSYNPGEADHANLIAIATGKAAKIAASDARLAVFSTRRKISEKSASETWMDEMEEGLPHTQITAEGISIKHESDDDTDDDVKGAAGRERKTNKTRKREKMEADKSKKRAELKKKRIRDNDVYSVKKIMKDIKTKEEEASEKSLRRKAKLEDPKRIKRLGTVKFSEPDIDVKLKEDIADNLRLLKPEGSLFVDRYISLQKRNILEPRTRQRVKRKYKLKQYQIEGRKMDTA